MPEGERCLDEASDPRSGLGVAYVRLDGAKRGRNSSRLPVLGLDERLDLDPVAYGCSRPVAFEERHRLRAEPSLPVGPTER